MSNFEDFFNMIASGGSLSLIDTQTFTESGVWTKPASAFLVRAVVFGGGAGGSSPGSAPYTSSVNPARSGSGGLINEKIFLASALKASENVTVGAGGIGGVGTGTTTILRKGTDGGTSSFGDLLFAPGGLAENASGALYDLTNFAEMYDVKRAFIYSLTALGDLKYGASASPASGADAPTNGTGAPTCGRRGIASGAGGAGGHYTNASSPWAASPGAGASYKKGLYSSEGGAAGAVQAAGVTGPDGSAGPDGDVSKGLGGGGGGGGAPGWGAANTSGGKGGKGGFPGGGGGGAGATASTTTYNGVDGGDGGDGAVYVETWGF